MRRPIGHHRRSKHRKYMTSRLRRVYISCCKRRIVRATVAKIRVGVSSVSVRVSFHSDVSVLTMSLISCVLNADSGRLVDMPMQ